MFGSRIDRQVPEKRPAAETLPPEVKGSEGPFYMFSSPLGLRRVASRAALAEQFDMLDGRPGCIAGSAC